MCIIDDQESDAWAARAEEAADAMPHEERQRHLIRCDYSPFPEGKKGTWGVIGSNGVVGNGYGSEREAENSILIGIGVFDDV